mmetsp:Transcript_41935/g.99899  ORF Transcript_41935/g.99899 Transcript_41935/m.99899 type:complete len:224 (-) Transcript_41935:218-889(-)
MLLQHGRIGSQLTVLPGVSLLIGQVDSCCLVQQPHEGLWVLLDRLGNLRVALLDALHHLTQHLRVAGDQCRKLSELRIGSQLLQNLRHRLAVPWSSGDRSWSACHPTRIASTNACGNAAHQELHCQGGVPIGCSQGRLNLVSGEAHLAEALHGVFIQRHHSRRWRRRSWSGGRSRRWRRRRRGCRRRRGRGFCLGGHRDDEVGTLVSRLLDGCIVHQDLAAKD